MTAAVISSTPTWQQARRAENRDRLLAAAAIVFARSGYIATTIEEILVEAGIGRTSFYKHFDDKLAIAAALFEQFMPELADSYGKIVTQKCIDQRTLAEWLDTLIDCYGAQANIMSVFAQVMVIEPRFAETIARVQLNIMERLGVRFAAFDKAAKAGPRDPLRTRASMLIGMIDQLCSAVALHAAVLDRAAAIAFVAEDFARFIKADQTIDIA